MRNKYLQIALAVSLIFVSLCVATIAYAAPHPALISVQWAWGAYGVIADGCNTPNGGGYSCLTFPSGGSLSAVEWSSAVKTPCHEVLIILNVSGVWQPLYVHHVAWGAIMPTIVRSLRLPTPLIIPPGGQIWLTAFGGPLCNFVHPLNTYPVEVQATIIVDGTDVPTVP